MSDTTELGLQTFRTCEQLFLQAPTYCDAGGSCDPRIVLDIKSEDVVGLESLKGMFEGTAALDIYPDSSAFEIALQMPNRGDFSLVLLIDGRY